MGDGDSERGTSAPVDVPTRGSDAPHPHQPETPGTSAQLNRSIASDHNSIYREHGPMPQFISCTPAPSPYYVIIRLRGGDSPARLGVQDDGGNHRPHHRLALAGGGQGRVCGIGKCEQRAGAIMPYQGTYTVLALESDWCHAIGGGDPKDRQGMWRGKEPKLPRGNTNSANGSKGVLGGFETSSPEPELRLLRQLSTTPEVEGSGPCLTWCWTTRDAELLVGMPVGC